MQGTLRSGSRIVLGMLVLAACRKAPPEPVRAVAAIDASSGDAGASASPEAAEPKMALADDVRAAYAAAWDLDPEDPARDYVRTYALATKRYGANLDCVRFGKSAPATGGDAGRVSVEVRDVASASCGSKSDVRDVFFVDVKKDRLTVDDPAHRAPLAAWPDGSKPGDPPAEIISINSVREWTSDMKGVFDTLRLTPMRIDLYGRGTYPVVSLAGWRPPLAKDAPDAKVREAVKKLCDANGGRPFAVTAELELRTWLRARCGSGAYAWSQSPIFKQVN